MHWRGQDSRIDEQTYFSFFFGGGKKGATFRLLLKSQLWYMPYTLYAILIAMQQGWIEIFGKSISKFRSISLSHKVNFIWSRPMICLPNSLFFTLKGIATVDCEDEGSVGNSKKMRFSMKDEFPKSIIQLPYSCPIQI